MNRMLKAGVVVSQVHVRNDHHTMFAEFRRVLPGLDEFTAEQVSLPVGWWLSEEQREHVVCSVCRLCGDAGD